MSPVLLSQAVFGFFAFMFGSIVGSFLNVVIYRVPRDMRVDEPKRSFCPSCNTQIPGWQNIPIFSWLWLRGRCASCGEKISPRYLIVELLTALLFLAVWVKFTTYTPDRVIPLGWDMALVYWVLVSLLVAATYIDFDFLIIPDSITKGGILAGIVASVAVPQLMGTDSRLHALGFSCAGVVVGYGLLWLIVNLGKLVFGRIDEKFDEPAPFRIHQPEGADEPTIEINGVDRLWNDVFSRASDKMIVDCSDLDLGGNRRDGIEQMVIFHDRFVIAGENIALEDTQYVTAKTTYVRIPREAMGFGDVKFIAMIGAFLGWKAVLFTIFAASVLGAVMGISQKVIAREAWSRPLPFGPYLALGALLWLFAGEAFVGWYLGLLGW